MAITEHPAVGALLICDFWPGFREPEMVKRRPVVVISPKIRARAGLCTVVALSTTKPTPIMPYHCEITPHPPLPLPWLPGPIWVKGEWWSPLAFTVSIFFGPARTDLANAFIDTTRYRLKTCERCDGVCWRRLASQT
jgi:hypothetical protein